MPMITRKGRKLAGLLDPGLATFQTLETCSLICRHATTHNRLMELACNGYPDDRAETRIELLITELVSKLPMIKNKAIKVKFSGDPRGYTVKIVMPDGRYNTWGGAEDGIGVPVF